MKHYKLLMLIIFIAALIIISTCSCPLILRENITVLRVSTTTSLYATGLLDMLADKFKEKHPNVVIQFIAVGSGEALKKAAMGDVDAVLVHAPSLERKYISEGTIGEGTIFAYNYFVIVGPKEDPAGVKCLSPEEAMVKIFNAGEKGVAKFISRGDRSGTHVRELMLWNMVGLNPKGKTWYIETGSGMSETLMVANEYRAYTLSDIGTFLKFKNKLNELAVLVDRGDILINIYSGYVVLSSENIGLAGQFIEFLVSSEAQEAIGNYGLEEYGQPLFYPIVGSNSTMLKNMWNILSSESS